MNNLGQIGEQLAKQHLEAKGWEFLEQNFRTRHGEIDLIFLHNDQVRFVEVKTRKTNNLVSGTADLDQRKLDRLEAAASEWLSDKDHESWSFDLLEVEVFENGYARVREVKL